MFDIKKQVVRKLTNAETYAVAGGTGALPGPAITITTPDVTPGTPVPSSECEPVTATTPTTSVTTPWTTSDLCQ